MTAGTGSSFDKPSTARMYSYHLCKASFEVGRGAAKGVFQSASGARDVARENFLFAGRAAAWAAKTHGIGQMLDSNVGIVGVRTEVRSAA